MTANPYAKLFEIDSTIFFRLAAVLKRNDSWKLIADFANLFDQQQKENLSAQNDPGLEILNELGTRLCEVRHLKTILRECALYDALTLISEPEPLQILKQPTEALNGHEKLWVKNGDPLTLEFSVVGVPPPKFSWFKDGNLLKGQDSCILHYEDFSSDYEGTYTCNALQLTNDTNYEIQSDSVTVETLPEVPLIVQRPPTHLYLYGGSPILLHIQVAPHQKPTFQWVHGNVLLRHETENVLLIPDAAEKHGGVYRCYVSNKFSEVIIETTVTIYAENSISTFTDSVPEKIALLVANDSYENLENLRTPVNDVKELALIFQELGFKTLCFKNLNLYEIEVVVSLLASLTKKGAFVVFYYAGHGFDCGDPYLLPVDCPDTKNYLKKDAFSESQLLSAILESEPALFVIILDMCLQIPDKSENENIFQEVSDVVKYKSDRNLVRAYATTVHSGAYEREDGCNSVYVSALKRHLRKKLPILAILGKVNKDITDLCPKQMPTISYNTAQDYYLHQEVKDEPEPNLYKKLEIKDTVFCVDSVDVILRQYSCVFNNAVEIYIHADKSCVDFECNWEVISIPGEYTLTLIIENLQRLREDLNLRLQINDCTENISLPLTYNINKFFEDI